MSYMYKMLFIPATLVLVYVKLATSNSVHMHVSPGVEECTIDVNGCSVPGNLPFFYKTKFTPACNKHDVCYSCGKLYGWSRNTCDHSFEKDMEYLCIHHYKRSLISSIITAVSKLIEEEEARCKASASFYYRAVEHFGAFYYIHDDPPKWCRQACISEYGSPYRQLRGFHNI